MEESRERKIPIDISFSETIKKSNLSALTGEISEAFIDTIINDGVLREIPLISSILGLNKAILTIKDRLFLKKIISFLNGIKQIDVKKRSKIINEINEGKDQKIKVGDKLIYILDKCDDHIIAQYIAQLFCGLLEERISYSDFLKGSKVIQTINLGDLEYFLNTSKTVFERTESAEEAPHEDDIPFINVGLIGFGTNNLRIRYNKNWDDSDKYSLEGGETTFYLTSIGKVIKENLFKPE